MIPLSVVPSAGSRVLIACLLLFACQVAPAQVGSAPAAGIADRTPRTFAITAARAVVKPGEVIEDATVLVRDGRIVAVGRTLAVPDGVVAIDLGGRTLFAGFIDANSSYAQAVEPAEAPARATRAPTTVAVEAGSRHWNRRIRPENDLATVLKPDPAAARALRGLGFAAVLSTPPKGILRGQSALVSTADETRLNPILLQPRVAQHIAFEQGNWPSNEYPTSLMGSIALIRQSLLDARWQLERQAWQQRQRDVERSEANLALDALQPLLGGRQPAIFTTADELDLGRALAIAEEFGLKTVLTGNGHEYRRVDELKRAGVPLILPLAWAEAPAIEDPDRALDVSLAELEHWEWSTFNPRVLAEAGVAFAFTSAGLAKPQEQFWVNLRKAVASGLDEDVALAALTTQPAAMLGVSDRLGSLEVGRLAHFVVADADLFRSADARIHEVWIDGRRHSIEPAGPMVDPRGTWTVDWRGSRAGSTLVIGGELKSLEATLGGTTFPALAKGTELILYPPGTLIGSAVERAAVVVAFDRARMHGRHAGGDGSEILFEGRRTAAARAKAPAKPAPPLPVAGSRYPAGEFGVPRGRVAPKSLVVRNATLWTQGPQGRLVNADIHVDKGRIRAIGTALAVPAGTFEVDARGKHVAPGIIDAHSHMAIARGVNESSDSVTSEVRVGDALDPTDITIHRQLAGGVTTAHLLHGSANAIGGQAQTIKLRWGEDAEGLRFAGAPPTIKFALGENVKQANWGEAFNTRYPQTRMGVREFMRDNFIAARDYLQRRNSKDAGPVRRDLRLEALAEILAGERHVHVHSYRQDEILQFIRVAREFGFVPTFQHVLEGYKVADEIAALGAGASTFSDWWAFKMEVIDAIPFNAALMTRQGVLVSLNSDSDELARRLNTEAAKAVKYGGLDEEAALALVTLNPARQLRIDQRVGSLEVGKDADFVIWSATPLSTLAVVEQTWIDGGKVFDRDDDAAERQRIERERARLVARILPERVKALAAKDGKAGKEDAPAGATPAGAGGDAVHHAALRTPYHHGEPVNGCTEDHR